MKVVLIGYMGSGKSSVGKILSNHLNIPFKDLDKEIESHLNLTIEEIFNQKGEIYFRKLESQVLKSLLSLKEDFVLATGGGTPCYGNSLAEMLDAPDTLTVYLKTSLPRLSERLFPERHTRPLIAHLETPETLMEFVGVHLFERSHFYNQAGLIIETSEYTPQQIAQRIAEKIIQV